MVDQHLNRPPKPEAPEILRHGVIVTPNNPPPPDIHANATPMVGLPTLLKANAGSTPIASHHVDIRMDRARVQASPPQLTIERPVGQTFPTGGTPIVPENGPQARGVVASPQLVQRPPRPIDIEATKATSSGNVEVPAGVCKVCLGTKMADVLKDRSGMIYSFRPCNNC